MRNGMQEGWQRRLAQLDLDRETLRAMFAPFAPGHVIETVEPLWPIPTIA